MLPAGKAVLPGFLLVFLKISHSTQAVTARAMPWPMPKEAPEKMRLPS